MRKVLVAVTDSAASLAAARAAVELAARLHGEVRALHVTTDGALSEVLATVGARVDPSAPVLRHVVDLATRAGVPVRAVRAEGDVAERILAEAGDWGADLVVIGHTTRHGTGEPFLSAAAQRVLEFSDRPVLVMPAQGAHSHAGSSGPRDAGGRPR